MYMIYIVVLLHKSLYYTWYWTCVMWYSMSVFCYSWFNDWVVVYVHVVMYLEGKAFPQTWHFANNLVLLYVLWYLSYQEVGSKNIKILLIRVLQITKLVIHRLDN